MARVSSKYWLALRPWVHSTHSSEGKLMLSGLALLLFTAGVTGIDEECGVPADW